MSPQADARAVRDLAKEYRAISDLPVQEKRRNLWRKHNSFHGEFPLIYVLDYAWDELEESRSLVCEDEFRRRVELQLRKLIYWHGLDDDSIFEPWFTWPAVRRSGGWGASGVKNYTGDPGGSYKMEYPIKDYARDLKRLVVPEHAIDEEATARQLDFLNEAFGGILEIDLARSTSYTAWGADISSSLEHLRGIGNVMMDMVDDPENLHRLSRFLMEGALKAQQEAEDAGDWGLTDHNNQAMVYSEDLEDPAPNTRGVKRSQLWTYVAAQEMQCVSPAMHDEFVLQYQLPILKKFGLVAYGCCEDLTNKIDMLRQVSNLRRISVTPFADVRSCAEQIGRDYILSYRPSPSDMVGYQFDRDFVYRKIRSDLEICREYNCHVDITLKDVETVGNDPDRVRNWVAVTREVIGDLYG